MTNAAGERRKLARACKKHGLLIQPNAMNAMLKEMKERNQLDRSGNDFNALLSKLQTTLARAKPKLITEVILRQVLEEIKPKVPPPPSPAATTATELSHSFDHDDETAQTEEDMADANDMDMEKEPEVDDIADIDTSMESDDDVADNGDGRRTATDDRSDSPPTSSPQRQNKEGVNFFGPTQSKKKKSPTLKSSSNGVYSPSWGALSAFINTPKLSFDSMRQQFTYDNNTVQDAASGKTIPAPLLGTAQDKLNMMTQRYKLVQQRTARCRQRDHQSYLTTIDRLLGHSNAADHGRPVVLLGVLHQSNGAQFSSGCHLELEDLTGTIPLRLANNDVANTMEDFDGSGDADFGGTSLVSTDIDPSGIYLEGTIVVVHGFHDNGIFHARRIELPPLEAPTITKPHLPPAPRIQPQYASNGGEFKMWTISNCIIDDPVGIRRLDSVIDDIISSRNEITVDDTKPSVENILVLFGDFTTDPTTLSADMNELARMLSKLPADTSVLILPGPADMAGSACWPLPAFPQRTCPRLHRMPNVHLCTNPCRMQLPSGHDVLLVRKDLIRESLRHQILSCPGAETVDSPSDEDDVRSNDGLITDDQRVPLMGRVIRHSLSQGHVMPQSPIYWNYDHSMHLYPVPDVMIVSVDADFDEGNTVVLRPFDHSSDKHRRSAAESTVILPCFEKSVLITLRNESPDKEEDTSEFDMSFDDDELLTTQERSRSYRKNLQDETGSSSHAVSIPLVEWKSGNSVVMSVSQMDPVVTESQN